MTLQQSIVETLEEKGFSKEQATEVFSQFAQSEMGEPLQGCLDDNVSGCDNHMVITIWRIVRQEAMKWVEGRCEFNSIRSELLLDQIRDSNSLEIFS